MLGCCPRGLICEADVADAAAVENAAAEVESAFGPIDVWINNAMASVFSPVHEMTAAEFKRVTDVTYLGVLHGTLSALKRMRPRDRGVIVQVGSALASGAYRCNLPTARPSTRCRDSANH
jgi:NAD(P)-dependent dehydrogenase (short-subunit alcohol dehydrogenase family)